MKSVLRASTLVTLAAIFLSACSDEDGILTAVDTGSPGEELTQASASSSTAEIKGKPRFQTEIAASGSFEPGKPVHIVATTQGNLATNNATITLLAPEFEAAQLSGWNKTYRLPVGVPLPPLVREQRSVGRGQTVVQSATLTFPEPGYYRVVLSAVASPEEPLFVDGELVVDASVSELWFIIGESGAGRVTSGFDPALIPAGKKPQPGPWRSRRAEDGDATKKGGLNGAASDDTILEISYLVSDSTVSGVYKKVPGVYALIEITNVISGNVATSYTTEADVNGRISLGCWGYEYEYDGHVIGKSDYIRVGTSDTNVGNFSGDFVECTALETTVIESVAIDGPTGRLVDNAQVYVPASRSLLSKSIARIDIKFTSGTSRYLESANRIEISTNPSNQAIWGGFGAYVQAHEYGHAVHDQALNASVGVSSNCANNHGFAVAIDLNCGMIEGFAAYHGIVTIGSSAGGLANTLENDGWSGTGQDGSIIEGAVASFFNDVTDPSNEGHDQVSYPGVYLADILRTCDAKVSGSWKKARGIDDLVYCFERQVDPFARDNFFQTRSSSQRATDQRESASEPSSWNQSKIRTLWLKNLYEQ